MNELKLKIKKVDRGTTLPGYAYFGDAGLDLYSKRVKLILIDDRLYL